MDEGTATRTSSPALDHLIERPRLTGMLDESGARVVLLVAPPGYGKTTLARQWARRQSNPVGWYRTTRASGDVAAFATGLDAVLAAAAPTAPGDRSRVAAIASVNARPEPLARAIVSIHHGLPATTLLVVDEYETAGTEEADALLGYVVDELDIRFLVTSRTRPPWFTPRLTVYGEGIEVGADELTMTDAEARDVLSGKASRADEARLLAVARGWPAVLGLAAMTAPPDIPQDTLLPRALYDYLATELLAAASAEVQEGLLLLAAASVGNVEVARLVLGDGSDALLDDAVRRGLALRVDDQSVSLHPLLQELLVARLKDRREAFATLLERLFVLIDHRRWDEALAVAEVLPDARFVSEVLSNGLDELLRAGRTTTVRRWVEIGRTTHADGGLVDYADGEVAFRSAEFGRALILGSHAAGQLDAERAALAHILASRAANLAERPRQGRVHSEAALALACSPEARGAAVWAQFNQAFDDERPETAQILATLQRGSRISIEQTIRAAQGSLRIGFLDGDLGAGLEDAQAIPSVFDHHVDPMIRTSFLNVHADALAVSARYTDALASAEDEEKLAESYELEFVRPFALLNKARALVGLRRFALAERAIAEVRRNLDQNADPYVSTMVAILRGGLYLSMGDLDRARGALLIDVDHRVAKAARGHLRALRAVVLAALRRTTDAEVEIAQSREISRSTEVRAFTAVAEALLALEAGREDDITAALRETADTGALDALVLGFRASPPLAAHAASMPGYEERVISLLSEANDAALARRIGLSIPRSSRRSQDLSPRELEIHDLIAHGMTNQEIARVLFISESTTKVHVRHILEKLGVRSRVEAARIWQDSEPRDSAREPLLAPPREPRPQTRR